MTGERGRVRDRWAWRPNLRWVPSVLLVVIALVAGFLASVSANTTWTSIWIGVISTATAAALVDASAVWERQRQFAPVRRLAARRVGRLHQLLLQMVEVVFDDVNVSSPAEWPAALRTIPDGPVNLSLPAAVYPSRTRQQFLRDLLSKLDLELEELSSLAAAGVLTRELDTVDEALRSSVFMGLVRDVFSVLPLHRDRLLMASEVAKVLTVVQAVLPVAARAAGTSWKYGEWPTTWRMRR